MELTTNTIQVKMSRTYYDVNPRYQGILWFKRFQVPENANWCILVGIYADFSNDIAEVKLKGNPDKADKMFGFNGKYDQVSD